VANPNASTRTTQYNVSYGSCTDYFSVVQQGKSIPSTYSYTLKSNITGATVSFRIGSSTLTDTTDSFGNATVTSTTNANATATITKSASQPNEGYFFQNGGVITIVPNGSRRVDGGMFRVNQYAPAPIMFTSPGWLSSATSLSLYPSTATFGVVSKPDWVYNISFKASGDHFVVNPSSSAQIIPTHSSRPAGTITVSVNGISTNKTFNVVQDGSYPP
jgi:hypothetical protein